MIAHISTKIMTIMWIMIMINTKLPRRPVATNPISRLFTKMSLHKVRITMQHVTIRVRPQRSIMRPIRRVPKTFIPLRAKSRRQLLNPTREVIRNFLPFLPIQISSENVIKGIIIKSVGKNRSSSKGITPAKEIIVYFLYILLYHQRLM